MSGSQRKPVMRFQTSATSPCFLQGAPKNGCFSLWSFTWGTHEENTGTDFNINWGLINLPVAERLEKLFWVTSVWRTMLWNLCCHSLTAGCWSKRWSMWGETGCCCQSFCETASWPCWEAGLMHLNFLRDKMHQGKFDWWMKVCVSHYSKVKRSSICWMYLWWLFVQCDWV